MSVTRRIARIALLAVVLALGFVLPGSPVLAAANQPPKAVVTATPNPAHAGQVVHLFGTSSTDPESPPSALLYAWSFGDGTSSPASTDNFTIDHIYADAGVYTASLTVTDPQGASNTASVVINVDDTAPVAAATASPTTAVVSQQVQFDGSGSSDAETAAADLTYAWQFEDGTTGTGIKPKHAFTAAGTYDVVLTVTDPQGASSTAKVTVKVSNTAPTAALSVTPASPHTGQVVTFSGTDSTDAETPNALTYDWDFGDGSAHATTAVATHTYATTGYKSVKLIVTDPQGLTSAKSQVILVSSNKAPVAVVTATKTKANVGQVVGFSGTGSSDAETPANQLQYSWDFGNGGSTEDATGATTSYAFTAPGTYTVTLTVTDGSGLTDSASVKVVVGNDAPTAALTVTPSPAFALQQVTLDASASTDAETPDKLTYSWSFGDGATASTGSTAKTTHAYATAGTYTVTVKVADAEGSTSTKAVALVVKANKAPVASPHASPNPVHAGKAVTFTSTGSSDPDGDAITYLWTFPGGSTADTATTTHTFATVGTYQVSLTVTDTHGVSTTSNLTITVTNGAPVAVAQATPNPVHLRKVVTFTGVNSSDPDGDTLTYHWDLPNGTTADTASVQLFFTALGSYKATLTVTDQFGLTSSDSVTVVVTNTAPVAAAQVTPNPAHVGKPVSFASDGSSDPDGDTVTYHWAFGDGATASTASASHTYAALGTYTATLTVTDQFGLATSKDVSVVVGNKAPVASAHASTTSAHTGTTVTFTSDGSSDPDGDTITYHWDFPGGSTANTATATQTFNTPGSYKATLTVTDQYGLTATSSVTVSVGNAAPVAAAQATPNPAHLGKAVSFTSDGSSDPDGDSVTYHWAFGDGATASTASASHTYTAVGTYTATLTVTDQFGLATSKDVSVVVGNKAPVASAHATPTSPHLGTEVTFTSDGSSDPDGDMVTYHWDFPGGATASTATATQTFNSAGSYAATLTVTDQYGLTATSSVTVTVVNDAPKTVFTNTTGLVLVGGVVTFDGRGSHDTESGSQLTYAWKFGDGKTATGSTTKHAFAAAGSYLVSLTTTDPQGRSSTATRRVDIARAVACQSASVTRTTQWRTVRLTKASGGSYCENSKPRTTGGTIRLTASGSSIGFTFGKSSSGGSAEVYVDGVLQGSISFHTSGATTFGNRKLFTGLSAGKHTVRITMVRGRGLLDDFLVFGPIG